MPSSSIMDEFRILFESAPALYLVLNRELTIVAASDAYLRATMTTREDIVGKSLFVVFPDNPNDPTATGVRNLRASLDRVLQSKTPDAMAVQKYDIRRPEHEGGGFEERYWSPVNSPVFDENDRVLYIIHRVEDVTEFVRLKSLGSKERRHNLALRSRAEEMESEIFLRARQIQEANESLRAANEELARKDKERGLIEIALRQAHADLECKVDERTAELAAAIAELQASEERYRLLFESNPQPMWVYDVSTLAFLAVNDAAIEHYGYSREEFLSMTILDIRTPEERPEVMEAVRNLSSDVTRSVMRKHRTKDGRVIDIEGSSREILFDGHRSRLVLATDITARRLLEEQFRQAQKMEAVGRLAGGIAHDFNNLLTAIIGYSDLLLGTLKEPRLRAEVGEIRHAGKRAASLTNQLLAFSRRQILQPTVLDLNEIVINLEKMLRRLIGEDIELVTINKSELSCIKADISQLEQIVMNLAVNARDAMPEGGKLTIEIANVDLEESYSISHPEVKPGPYVLLAVSDTGHGMDAKTQSQVFEPFFTTKELGKGTGLGLSTVYGIVKQSGGHIWIYSEKGYGATFKIYLPRVNEVVNPAETDLPASRSLTGSETIMLVEDDDLVRKLSTSVLEGYGYTVLAAEDGRQALEFLEPLATTIDLVITDVVMPGMGGAQMVSKLRAIRPNIKILYVSGYTAEASILHGVLEEGVEFLPKPFTPEGLAAKVRNILDSLH